LAALRLTGRSRNMKAVLWSILAIVAAVPVEAQESMRRTACVAIDEARDTFSAADRHAAVTLVARQFELAGRQIVSGDCPERYTLSHVQLGNTITVTLAGPGTLREGVASGMDDLPALYNQMVRAILTGSSVGAMNVVDRANVTTPQAEPKRMHADSFGYGRLGYGRMLGTDGSGNATMGFGYRAEMDSFGLDVSFLNFQLPSSAGMYGSSGGSAVSLLKLEGLYFLRPKANASAYFGGGLSWGAITGTQNSAPYSYSSSSSSSYSSWSGRGLQGELTAGYELPRASELRVFIQADATLPFYRTTGQTFTYSAGRSSTVHIGRRYNPSIALSIGLGWQRHRR
jgi:hypothetical protein